MEITNDGFFDEVVFGPEIIDLISIHTNQFRRVNKIHQYWNKIMSVFGTDISRNFSTTMTTSVVIDYIIEVRARATLIK